jgi:hypothetical protein
MKVAIIGDIVIKRSDVKYDMADFETNEYLNPREKAFLKANQELKQNTKKGTKKERLSLEVVDMDWYYNQAYELVDIRTTKTKEIERNTYTEHVFEDGTVMGEVERLTW